LLTNTFECTIPKGPVWRRHRHGLGQGVFSPRFNPGHLRTGGRQLHFNWKAKTVTANGIVVHSVIIINGCSQGARFEASFQKRPMNFRLVLQNLAQLGNQRFRLAVKTCREPENVLPSKIPQVSKLKVHRLNKKTPARFEFIEANEGKAAESPPVQG